MLRRMLADRNGASATEFAVIAPVLAFLLLGIVDGWSLATSTLGARAAVEAAATYFIGGGADPATAQLIAQSSWNNPPPDASVAVSESCACSGAASGCGGICAATSMPPAAYMHIAATGTWTAPFSVQFLGSQVTVSQTQVIRVR